MQHTGAYAHFANGGMTARPYGILEMYNSKGDLIYSRDRDEPAPVQVVSRKVAEQMNQMMLAVVTNGTAAKAQLDFTTVVGKTGTSSSYRDAWFVGFTGALVTGVWVGFDDFTPMNNITGGSLPTQAWHSYMQVALRNYRSIPPIPGIAPHPNQVADQQRMADLRRSDPAQAQAQAPQATAQRKASLMPDRTREVLKKVAENMRHAAGLAPTPAVAPGPAVPAAPASAAPPPPGGAPPPKSRPPEPKAPEPKAKATSPPPERRAEAPDTGGRPPR
jgi:penicillin-binding protein 1A